MNRLLVRLAVPVEAATGTGAQRWTKQSRGLKVVLQESYARSN
jgi:hypothetical protein